MNPPVDGCTRENCDSVLPSSAMAMAATMIVSGAATPAVRNRKPAPKKKLYAGPMFAIVEAEMSTSRSAPRCSRSGDSGDLVSEKGTDAASLIGVTPGLFSLRARADPGKRFPVLAKISDAKRVRKGLIRR